MHVICLQPGSSEFRRVSVIALPKLLPPSRRRRACPYNVQDGFPKSLAAHYALFPHVFTRI